MMLICEKASKCLVECVALVEVVFNQRHFFYFVLDFL